MSIFKKIFHYFNWDEKESKEKLLMAIKEAVADDMLTAEEMQELLEIKQLLRVSETDFEALLAPERPIRLTEAQLTLHAWLQSLEVHWQKVLEKAGLSANKTAEELKYAFRGLSHLTIHSDAQLSDYSPLQYLIFLKSLDIDIVKAFSLLPLEYLPQLQYLNISYLRSGYGKLQQVEVLSKCTQLEKLVLKYLKNVDFKPIVNLKKLTHLELTHQDLPAALDISLFYTLTVLETLILEGTPLQHIRPLANFKQLKHLNVQDTQLASLEGIESCTQLSQLYLGQNPTLKDIQPLAQLPYIETLDLSATQVEDLSPLATLNDLRHLDIFKTKVQDLSPLYNLPQLAVCKVSDTVERKQIHALKNAIPTCDIEII